MYITAEKRLKALHITGALKVAVFSDRRPGTKRISISDFPTARFRCEAVVFLRGNIFNAIFFSSCFLANCEKFKGVRCMNMAMVVAYASILLRKMLSIFVFTLSGICCCEITPTLPPRTELFHSLVNIFAKRNVWMIFVSQWLLCGFLCSRNRPVA